MLLCLSLSLVLAVRSLIPSGGFRGDFVINPEMAQNRPTGTPPAKVPHLLDGHQDPSQDLSEPALTDCRSDPCEDLPLSKSLRARLSTIDIMASAFAEIWSVYDAREKTREKIKEVRNAADLQVSAAQSAIGQMLSEDNLEQVAQKALIELKATGPLILEIEKSLPDEPDAYFRYSDSWNQQLQSCTTTAVLVSFLTKDDLPSIEVLKEMLGAPVRISTETYLIGVCNVMPELCRLSMNRVIKMDYEIPRRCAAFANEISEGFKQLNLRNDFLRKRYDGIKYDVKRLEEIMYDLSIRGLVKAETPKPEI